MKEQEVYGLSCRSIWRMKKNVCKNSSISWRRRSMKLINLTHKPAKPETYGERLAQAIGLSRMLAEFSEKKGFEPSVL